MILLSFNEIWECIEKLLPQINLKLLSNSQWENKGDAILPLKLQLEAICSAFLDTFDPINSDIHSRL